MIPSFKQYLVEENREVFFTFGRMNPPTAGHGKLIAKLSTKAGKNPYKIFLSQSHDSKRNPIDYTTKIKYARKMFPKYARNIILDKSIKTVFDVMVSLFNEGYNRVFMVVGSDRVTEFETSLKKYNGEKGKHGFYNFESIVLISSGERDPESQSIEGVSASRQRDFAKNNDFLGFSQGLPNSFSSKDSKRLFNDIRTGMGLNETTSFKNHIELGAVSPTREKFVKGELFNLSDDVIIKECGRSGSIQTVGTNYVIVALDEGGITRQWIDSVEAITEKSIAKQIVDFIDSKINAKKYASAINTYRNLKKRDPSLGRQNIVKAAQIHRVDTRTLIRIMRDLISKKKLGNDPLLESDSLEQDIVESGQDATNESKSDEMQKAKDRILRDKKRIEIKHDRILDRARLNKARRKNKQTRPIKR